MQYRCSTTGCSCWRCKNIEIAIATAHGYYTIVGRVIVQIAVVTEAIIARLPIVRAKVTQSCCILMIIQILLTYVENERPISCDYNE